MGRLRVTSGLIGSLLATQEGALRTISEMEKEMELVKQDLAKKAVDALLERLAPEDGKPKPCPCCGRHVRLSKRDVEREFEATSGRHKIQRHYYYCSACKCGFYPRDAELGLPPDGEATYELERRMLDLSVNTTYREGAERFHMHYGREFSENFFRRVTERVGKRMGEADDTKLYALACPPPPGQTNSYRRLTVMNDGCMLPMMGGGFQEAKLAVMVRNDDVEPSRYVGHWGKQEEFRNKLHAALHAERSVRYDEMVWVADGARGNWGLSGDLGLNVTEVLDFGHAVENAMKCARVLFGENNPWLALWQRRIEMLLRAGDPNALISELMDCIEYASDDQLEALNQLVGYYRYNDSRMNYPEYRRRDIPLGSGRVESAHRHVLQCRMKLAGQHWSDRHGKRMVEMRALYKTAGCTRFYDVINRAYVQTHYCVLRANQTRRRPDIERIMMAA
jgi:hypothetical protein